MKQLQLHNATWPGLVGKSDADGGEPPISLDRMIELTAAARGPRGEKFDGVDLIILPPHFNLSESLRVDQDQVSRIADALEQSGLSVGSIAAPVWKGSAMGTAKERERFVRAVELACEVGSTLHDRGIRTYGSVRIDSAAFGLENWRENPVAGTARIVGTFARAAEIASHHGEKLVAEGEICWAGMHSWRHMLEVLEGVGQPGLLGFQADLAHTYLYLLGHNAPEHALLKEGYSGDEFWAAYQTMTDALRPWTLDFHVAQNDGTVKGGGDHDATGRHCTVDDPNGKVDIVRASQFWLKGARERDIQHICWDGCMFPNATIENPETWNKVLAKMVEVREANPLA